MNNFIIYAVVFYAGAWFVKLKLNSMEDLFSSLYCIMFAAFSAGQASLYIPDVGVSYVAAKSIFEIIDLPTESELSEQQTIPIDFNTFKADIIFENVFFKYPSRDNYVL